MNKNKLTIFVDFDYTLFDTTKFVEFLSSSPNNINYKDFLYSDALDFIGYASKFGELTLFSEGEVDFQREKIISTGIDKLFSGGIKIFPSYSKAANFVHLEDGQKAILIDDKPEIIDQGISLGYQTIRVKRGKYVSQETKESPRFVVDNLSEIVERNLLQGI